MTRTKIWIISLADAAARRAQMEQSLRNSALDWQFFAAHRELHGALRYTPSASHAAHGRTLRAAELGCYSSHYAAWQWLLDSEYEQMLVFEDDVAVDWDFIAQLATTDFTDLHIPYLRLFAKIPPRWRYVASPFFDRYHHLIRITGYALGTQAYLLTKTGAQQFVTAGTTIRYSIDAFMDRYWEHGVENLALFPFPVFERVLPSSIGAARFAAERTPALAQWQFRARRARERVRAWIAYFGPEPAVIRELKNRLRNRFVEPACAERTAAESSSAAEARPR